MGAARCYWYCPPPGGESIIAAWENTDDEYLAHFLRGIALIYHYQVSTRQPPHTAEDTPPAHVRACAHHRA